MGRNEQKKPPTPAANRTSCNGEEAASNPKKSRHKRCIKCCGCITASVVVLAIVIVALIFTVFRVKEPIIRLNNVIITHMELINNTIPKPGTNISLIADVSVKNPNAASFQYDNTTSALYHHGVLVGEARGPPGHSRARRTMRLNTTVDLVTDNLLSSPNLSTDIGKGLLTMDSYTILPGRVKILIVNKHVIVKTNCSVTVNISSRVIQSQKCKNKIAL